MAKEVSKSPYRFFNKNAVPETPALLMQNVLAKMNELLSPLGLDTGELWGTTMKQYGNLVEVSKTEPTTGHFYRWWVDQVVGNFGAQLFNVVFATRFVNRLDPNKSDRDADTLATKVANQYYDAFS